MKTFGVLKNFSQKYLHERTASETFFVLHLLVPTQLRRIFNGF